MPLNANRRTAAQSQSVPCGLPPAQQTRQSSRRTGFQPVRSQPFSSLPTLAHRACRDGQPERVPFARFERFVTVALTAAEWQRGPTPGERFGCRDAIRVVPTTRSVREFQQSGMSRVFSLKSARPLRRRFGSTSAGSCRHWQPAGSRAARPEGSVDSRNSPQFRPDPRHWHPVVSAFSSGCRIAIGQWGRLSDFAVGQSPGRQIRQIGGPMVAIIPAVQGGEGRTISQGA